MAWQASDVSYRNAMMTLSARGWRRDEPGLISVIEQPSLLPRAVELLEQEGVDKTQLLEQCRVPPYLFDVVTARSPGHEATIAPTAVSTQSVGGVVSLLGRIPASRR